MGANEFKERLGKEAFLWFGQCGLSLKAPKDPVATPEGYIYDREYILEYLVKKKKELAEQKERYDRQEATKEAKEKEKVKTAKEAELQKFHDAEMGITVGDSLATAKKKEGPTREVTTSMLYGKAQQMASVDKIQAQKQSFWAPEARGAGNAEATVKKPELIPRCPMSGKKLRLKELIPVKLERLGTVDDGPGMFCCAVSKKAITHQQAVLLKPSGVVLLEDAYEKVVKKGKVCPVTSKKLHDGDVIKLQMGGTGFASHNEVEVRGSKAAHGLGFGMESDGRLLKGACGGTGMWIGH